MIDTTATTHEVLCEFGKRIRTARISQTMTQQELAEKAGLSMHTVCNAEQGNDISLSTAIALLRALDLLSGLDIISRAYKLSESANETKQRVRKKRLPDT